jgi:hypothetical protein
MSSALNEQRSARLQAAMHSAQLELLVIASNAWRNDYLRYALDITTMEGQAVALIGRQGQALVFVDSPAEAARLSAENPQLAGALLGAAASRRAGGRGRQRGTLCGAGPGAGASRAGTRQGGRPGPAGRQAWPPPPP